MVNQKFADRYFPNSVALGKKIWGNGRNRPPSEIVGIVTNGRTADLTRAAEPEIYLPLWQAQAFSKKDLGGMLDGASEPGLLIPGGDPTGATGGGPENGGRWKTSKTARSRFYRGIGGVALVRDAAAGGILDCGEHSFAGWDLWGCPRFPWRRGFGGRLPDSGGGGRGVSRDPWLKCSPKDSG